MGAELVLELYGVRACIQAEPIDLLNQIDAGLPQVWARPTRTASPQTHIDRAALELNLTVTSVGDGNYRIAQNGTELMTAGIEHALDFLGSHLDQQLALNSPDKIFVHAGVVAIEGSAAMIVGGTFAGKTTLVTELVRSGASYLSDEYAVLDMEGLVHPFPRNLSVRIDGGTSRSRVSAESIGGSAGTEALPVRIVLLTCYQPDAQWSPHRLSGGEAVLAVLKHTAQARERPAHCLKALRRVVQEATVLEGKRGDAAVLIPRLLDALAGRPA